jgi:two-component system, cell cycle sensor histidine kinase and response regulator CckA
MTTDSFDAYVRRLRSELREGGAAPRRRVRELICLLEVDRALRRAERDWGGAIQDVAEALPRSCPPHGRCGARIRVGDRTWTSSGYRPAERSLVRPLQLADELLGEVELVLPPEDESVLPGSPSLNGSAEVEGAGVVEVVADRLARTLERRRTEIHQRTLVEASPVALFSIDPDGTVLSWNRAAERIFGWTAEEAVGCLLPLVPPDAQDEFEGLRERAAAGESFSGLHLVRRRKDGSQVHLSLSVAPVTDDAGPVSAIMCAAEDVTRQQEAWDRIRFQSELLEAVGQAVVSTDVDGRIAYWNRTATSLYGWTAGEALGRQLSRVIPGIPSPASDPDLGARLEEGRSVTEEGSLRRKDGSAFQGLVTSSPILDGDGELAGMISVVSDISELKELEAHLRHSQKMEAVGRLAGGVAHDFNNLLTVIGSHAQMLLEDLPDGSGLDQDIRMMQSEIRRASRLTRQLLALGRRQATQTERLQLDRAMAELEPVLRRLVPSRVELAFQVEGEPHPVMADGSQLSQVVLNLAVNASDAISGEGRIVFGVDRCPLSPERIRSMDWSVEPGEYVRLTVEDTGHGMSRDVVERAFEPFFSTKPEGEGSGLGLSTVFGIVKQNGGCILVDSEVDRGTTFQVLWPVAPEPAEEPEGESTAPDDDAIAGPEPDAAAARSGGETAGGQATVLVVDDTQAVVDIARRVLERAGHTVHVAANGEEAMDMLSSLDADVDVVVSDVVMPRMGGARLLTYLQMEYPDVPVVLMSGHSDRELSEPARSQAHAFLAKPFTPEELVRAVRESLFRD